jgi:hypothetical protein
MLSIEPAPLKPSVERINGSLGVTARSSSVARSYW